MSLIQFPLFAVAFVIGIRCRPVALVVAVLALTYALLVGIAHTIVKAGMWPNHALQRTTPGEVAWFANSRLPRPEPSLSLGALGMARASS